MKKCRKCRPTRFYAEKQGLIYNDGISRDSVGVDAICMHLLAISHAGRAKAHKHATPETAIYMLERFTNMHWAQALEHTTEAVVS